MRETWVWSLGWEDPLEKGKTSHSSILAWRIPWTVYSPWGCKESDMTEQLSLHSQTGPDSPSSHFPRAPTSPSWHLGSSWQFSVFSCKFALCIPSRQKDEVLSVLSWTRHSSQWMVLTLCISWQRDRDRAREGEKGRKEEIRPQNEHLRVTQLHGAFFFSVYVKVRRTWKAGNSGAPAHLFRCLVAFGAWGCPLEVTSNLRSDCKAQWNVFLRPFPPIPWPAHIAFFCPSSPQHCTSRLPLLTTLSQSYSDFLGSDPSSRT